jgi:hypothetical protein
MLHDMTAYSRNGGLFPEAPYRFFPCKVGNNQGDRDSLVVVAVPQPGAWLARVMQRDQSQITVKDRRAG